MRERKNTVLLFSKLPEVGLVKTRLTTLKDGWFEPEVASALYHCMLFDVVEIICAALADLEEADAKGDVRDTYELVISTAPARNLEPMRKLFEDAGTWPREIVFINDEGSNFDEHYNHAFQQAWDRGADCILSMGADMPALTKSDVKFGFEQLHKLNLHACVTYFVDYNSKDVKDFLLQYRALFMAEPSRSAYSGYDLMRYFSTLSYKYGKKWPKALDRVDFTGLQSDFKLERTASGSFINTAVRRVVYNPDYSVSLVR